jgi:hypothetical protein
MSLCSRGSDHANHSFLIAATLSLGLGTAAQAVSLSTLLTVGTLVQGDATFENFSFLDLVTDPLPGDRPVSADQIDITTSSTANTVSLTATIDPAISITGGIPSFDEDGNPIIVPGIFGFFLDFGISIAGSSRETTGVSLAGDVSASGPGNSEVLYFILGSSNPLADLEIFADGFDPPQSQTSDSTAVAPTTFMGFEGLIQGFAFDNATAGLSTFTLTFELRDPAAVIPLPAGLPLLLAGVGALALFRRRKT